MIETSIVAELRGRLGEYLEAVTGQDVDVVHFGVLPGSAAQESWQVKAKVGEAAQSFVLRRDPPIPPDDNPLPRDQEFRLIKAAHETGVRVLRPRWYCLEPLILDQPFFMMDYVDGIADGAQLVSLPELAEARKLLPGQMGEQLAKIHAIDPTQHKLDFLPQPRASFSPAQETIASIRAMILKLGVHNPVFEFGLRWAEQNAPKTDKTVVLHGDFQVGNLLVNKTGLAGILDWEYARLGDPLEDLAWPCLRAWRFGRGDLQLGGIGAREPFIQAYEQASGRAVDHNAVDYWEILANLRRAVTCLVAANRRVSGGHASVERASLGRRSAEMQFEMLRLIGAGGQTDHV